MNNAELEIQMMIARYKDRATTNPPSGYDAGVIDGLNMALAIIRGEGYIITQER